MKLTIPEVEKTWSGYPVVIMQARYSGVYERGKWICIPNFSADDPLLIGYMDGDDDDALDFIESHHWEKIGIGRSPNASYASMIKKSI